LALLLAKEFALKVLILLGIDTPETYGVKKSSEEYQAGLKAKERVKNVLDTCVIHHGHFLIETSKKGKFGRWLAEITLPHFVTASGETISWSLNALLLEEGLAKPYN